MNSIPSYLKKTGVLRDGKIIDAFRAIDRADFLPEELKSMAYSDEALPIGGGQTISQPYTVAFMLDLLDPRPGEIVMDVGAGSGWQTALLAYVVSVTASGKHSLKLGFKDAQKPSFFPSGKELAGKVFAIERVPELCKFGQINVSKYNFIASGVVEWFCKNASDGLPDEVLSRPALAGGVDKIIAAASIVDLEVPKAWKEQLKIGGKMVVPIGNSLRLFIKQKDGGFNEREFPGFVFVPFIKEKSWT